MAFRDVYADPFGIHDHPSQTDEGDSKKLNYVFEMERSACALFGVVTFGVHLSIYSETVSPTGVKDLLIWVPTRSRTKQTWPGYLDNTVAGGIPSGMSVTESLIKECLEEATLSADIVRKHAVPVGSISYLTRTVAGWLQPEVQYVFDMCIPSEADQTLFTPRPQDGEVEAFEFLQQHEVIRRMRAGLFKPNCALVLLDLFIRRGIINADNEPHLLKLSTRLHGQFDFEDW